MKALRAGLCALCLICLAFAGFLWGLRVVFLDSARYTALMDQLNVYDYVGISRGEQTLINQDLADYLAGKRTDLKRRVTLLGELVDSPFNDREMAHMRDVRQLFKVGIDLMWGLTVAGAALLLVCFFAADRAAFRRGLIGSLATMGIVAAVVAVVALTADFDALFIRFHELFFSNDLWLLNPATDAMIRMLPQAFFERMAVQGVAQGLLMAAVLYMAGCAILLFEVLHGNKHSGRGVQL